MAISSPRHLQLLARQHAPRLFRSLGFAGSYAAWTIAFRLLVLTFVTYFLMSSSHPPKFEDITETFGANELSLMGMGAILFVAVLRALYPITTTTTEEIFHPSRFEKNFLPGFAHGAVLAAGVILAFLLGGTYRYLGFFIQFDEAPLAAITVVVRIAALGAFVYFEEFIFRHKITGDVKKQFFGTRTPGITGAAMISALVALIYCAIKAVQFDLGIMQLLTLFLVSLALSTRTLIDGDFGRGAGFWSALLIVFQPLLSLPVLGSDFSGVLLIKYQPNPEGSDSLIRLLTGGAGGPLSSLALQLILAIDIVRGLLLYKKRS